MKWNGMERNGIEMKSERRTPHTQHSIHAQ